MAKESRILVALDGMTEADAKALAKELKGVVAGFKVNDLIDECGISICDFLSQYGEVMADPKLKDIPATMRNRAKRYARCNWLTVHASNTDEALQAAVKAVPPSCKVLGVTVLTSMTETDCADIYYDKGMMMDRMCVPEKHIARKVYDFAGRASVAGLAGLVCSGQELPVLKPDYGFTMKFVVPGLRSAGASVHDQKRVMTLKEAVNLGAYRVVVGREITTESPDPVASAMRINEDVSAAS